MKKYNLLKILYLAQRVSITIQRGNGANVFETITTNNGLLY